MKGKTLIAATIALTAQLFFMVAAEAGSFYRWGASEGPYPTYMDVDFYWSHSKADKYTKYEFCWRPRNADRNGKNPCDYNTRKVNDPEVHFKATNEKIHGNKVYKYRIRAKKESNGNWVNLTSTVINPCFRTPVGGHQQLDLTCGPK